MSLLQQNPGGIDETRPGDELTRGSSHLVVATLVAAVVVSIAIAIYVIAEQKPPAAVGEVTRVVTHMMHRESTGLDASGNPMPKEVFDQVLVFTHVRLRNQSDKPLFLRQIISNVTLDDGIHSSYAATPTDYERLFKAYPDLAPLHGTPLGVDQTIPAGQTLDGDFVSSFRIPKEQWDARKALDFDVSLRYQPDLKLTPTQPVISQ